jgi:secreted trypsin-like serine protease
MVVFEADGEPTEVGVVSFVADEGCETGLPSGFTRVSKYLNWLEKHGGITIRD